jgi:hypothetical protein
LLQLGDEANVIRSRHEGNNLWGIIANFQLGICRELQSGHFYNAASPGKRIPGSDRWDNLFHPSPHSTFFFCLNASRIDPSGRLGTTFDVKSHEGALHREDVEDVNSSLG